MENKSRPNILWTDDYLIASEKMVFMYGINAKRKDLWDEVTIIIWGATAKLAGENKLIQEFLEEAKLEGVHITACKACADQFGLSETLESLGIEVIHQADHSQKYLKMMRN